MIEYKSLGKYHITGRGDAFSVEAPFDFEDRSVLYGPAKIDGTVYEVIGVEAYAMVKIRKGSPIGLLVKPDGSKVGHEGT